jgi:hypothetical protein
MKKFLFLPFLFISNLYSFSDIDCNKFLMEAQLNHKKFDINNNYDVMCIGETKGYNILKDDLPLSLNDNITLKDIKWFKHFSLGFVLSFEYTLNYSDFNNKPVVDIIGFLENNDLDIICNNPFDQQLFDRKNVIINNYHIEDIDDKFSIYIDKKTCEKYLKKNK